jgi:hypothetical protein
VAAIWTVKVKSVCKFSNEVPSAVLRIRSVDVLEDLDFIFCRTSSLRALGCLDFDRNILLCGPLPSSRVSLLPYISDLMNLK